MYTTIAINQETHDLLKKIKDSYKEKYNLNKLSNTAFILAALKQLELTEGL